ncbi:cytochrome oxidase assembly protein [Intrasporangium oryzae NRRL B-24470]|uniref:Cytochrome oxidase assembly protein n=1 Tax=Intrasporangium oryzae NRRL B-24470 TaxID=1386089 RepID=W9GD76_9MICO|nr:COX15/CtaA family protein [Intrasporangium oryzae]EWT01824.1 cytochrome oxidase assembly protein [Intrasporangium oryzae NRRL B-24470]
MSSTSTLTQPKRAAAANRFARVVNRLPAAPAGWVRPVLVANLVGEVGIVVTGGVVRLTGSGLGCTTWPECMPGSFTPVREDPTQFHDLIEFGNRTLTGVVGILAIATIWAVVTRWPQRTRMHVLAVAVLGGVLAQAVAGGITVRTGLNPWTVMFHFLMSMALVAVSTALVRGARDEESGPGDLLVHPLARRAAQATCVVGFAVLLLGTVVTGSGPHSGDAVTPARTGFDPRFVSWMHADLVMLFGGLVVATLLAVRLTATRPEPTRAWWWVLAVTVGQGVIGYVQYFTGLPEVLVILHMLGASLLVVTLTLGLLGTRTRPV